MFQDSYCPIRKLYVLAGQLSDYDSLRVSHDNKNWFMATWEWLVLNDFVPVKNPEAEEVAYNRDGEVVGAATKAMEATPKYIPPIFEEREV